LAPQPNRLPVGAEIIAMKAGARNGQTADFALPLFGRGGNQAWTDEALKTAHTWMNERPIVER
jgi:hypothetical protein